MKHTGILLLLVLLMAAPATAADQIKTANDLISGTIESITPVKIVIKERNADREVPVGEIISVRYDGEPGVLKTARGHIDSGRYEDAVEALSELNTAEITRRPIAQDVEYYRAYCAAQLALVGNGEIADAGRKIFAFINANKDSYHYLEAQMLFGDLAAAAGNQATAQNAYKAVGQQAQQARWPEYFARAAVALGRSYLAEGKTAEASNIFKAALNTSDTVPGVQVHKLAATLGEARCMAAAGDLEPAIKKIEDVIRQADSEDYQLLADAYNALGSSYRAAKQPKDAVLAFLNVHLVYFNSPQSHIEALQNLVEVWSELNMPERSNEAAAVLRDRYKRSPR